MYLLGDHVNILCHVPDSHYQKFLLPSLWLLLRIFKIHYILLIIDILMIYPRSLKLSYHL